MSGRDASVLLQEILEQESPPVREFFTVVYGPVMSFAFPDVQVKAYRNSELYVNLVSVVDCSVLNWVEQRELRGLASDDRLFGRIAEPGWVSMDFNNHFKCRMGHEDLSHIQFNPKLWNLRPVVKDTGAAMRVPLLPEAYAHAKENQQAWLSGSRPLPDQCPRYPPIRRMLLGVTSPVIAPRIGAARDVEKRMLKWSEGMEPRFIRWNVAAAHTFEFSFLMLGVGKRSRHHLPGDQRSRLKCGTRCILPQMTYRD